MSNKRREFLKKTAVSAVGAHIIPAWSWSKQVAPSDQINVGLIGCRNRGWGVLRNQLKNEGVRCLGLCDVDQNILNERNVQVHQESNQKPKLYLDFRKMLEDKDIDAVIIGTPDHWHCLQTVYACQAGKDVYVEKPLANTIEECNIMVEAVRRYNRVVQVGQQQRSSAVWTEAMRFIKSGKLGTLRKVNIWANFNYGIGSPKQPDAAVPQGVDFDFWLGPAPLRSFNPARFHGSWRHFWDYGGGLMTDWGVHLIDMALWAKDVTHAPTTVMAYGENLSFEDYARETYDTMSVIYPMEDYVITWQHAAGLQNGPYNMLYGVEFVGDKATLVANREKWMVNPEDKSKSIDKEKSQPESKHKEVLNDTDLHMQNFLECIKSREEPNCTIENGRNVSLYAHMGNLAVRSGEGKLVW
ncbi:Gfo/Idh/MocA family protein [Pararhodonellum marinum]|uniref:Gfo/Idh/MocA family protein n=1 Tax=Pararhodonellum marinum TaxID=2755358 RepID=UPI001E32D651|nr:Gfo/Idh/MocA family oxidoreductase [Pararhodonellum marinum]